MKRAKDVIIQAILKSRQQVTLAQATWQQGQPVQKWVIQRTFVNVVQSMIMIL